MAITYQSKSGQGVRRHVNEYVGPNHRNYIAGTNWACNRVFQKSTLRIAAAFEQTN